MPVEKVTWVALALLALSLVMAPASARVYRGDKDLGKADAAITDAAITDAAINNVPSPVLADPSGLAQEPGLATQTDEVEINPRSAESEEALDRLRLDTFSSSLMTSGEFDED